MESKKAKHEFCCDSMQKEIEFFESRKLNSNGMPYAHIEYRRDERKYLLFHFSGDWKVGGLPIDYCPFCGTKLPTPLDPEEVICEEYGEDYVRLYHDPKYKPLPLEVQKEFQTDEWWKKRGL